MTSRIHHGFHRIGVVLAVPLFLVAGWITLEEAWQAWSTSGLSPEKFIAADGGFTFEEAFGTHHAYFGHALAWAGVAFALYVAARAVGWIVDGFMAPSPRPQPPPPTSPASCCSPPTSRPARSVHHGTREDGLPPDPAKSDRT